MTYTKKQNKTIQAW